MYTECKRQDWNYVPKHYSFSQNVKHGTGITYRNTKKHHPFSQNAKHGTGIMYRNTKKSLFFKDGMQRWHKKYVQKYYPFEQNAKDGTGNHIIRLERRD